VSRKTEQAAPLEHSEKTSKLSVEIFRLMRDGSVNSRTKAQELLQTAIEKRHAEKHYAQVKGDAS
jgi:hypothetical protein